MERKVYIQSMIQQDTDEESLKLVGFCSIARKRIKWRLLDAIHTHSKIFLLTLSHLFFDYQRVVQWARREQKCTDRQLAFILGFMIPACIAEASR